MGIKRIENGVAPSNAKLKVLVDDHNTLINSYGSDQHIFTPPAGYQWEVKGLEIQVQDPNSSFGGEHYVTLGYADFTVLSGSSVHTQDLEFAKSIWKTVTNASPTSETATLAALTSLYITKADPLIITYYNLTDAQQTNTRYVRLFVLEKPLTQ